MSQRYGKISLGWSSGRKVVEGAKQIEKQNHFSLHQCSFPDRVLVPCTDPLAKMENDLGIITVLWIQRPNRGGEPFTAGKLKQSFVPAVSIWGWFSRLSRSFKLGPQGVARSSAAGRCGHQPGAISRVFCAPQAMELIEYAAAREAMEAERLNKENLYGLT